jgi:hypothetical protein
MGEGPDLNSHLDEFEGWLAASDWAGVVKLRMEESLKFLDRFTRERRSKAVQIRERLLQKVPRG